MVSVGLEKKMSTLSSRISLKRRDRKQPLMTTVAPVCWDDTSKAMHNVSIRHKLSHRNSSIVIL